MLCRHRDGGGCFLLSQPIQALSILEISFYGTSKSSMYSHLCISLGTILFDAFHARNIVVYVCLVGVISWIVSDLMTGVLQEGKWYRRVCLTAWTNRLRGLDFDGRIRTQSRASLYLYADWTGATLFLLARLLNFFDSIFEISRVIDFSLQQHCMSCLQWTLLIF